MEKALALSVCHAEEPGSIPGGGVFVPYPYTGMESTRRALSVHWEDTNEWRAGFFPLLPSFFGTSYIYIVARISACHVEDPGSFPGGGVLKAAGWLFLRVSFVSVIVLPARIFKSPAFPRSNPRGQRARVPGRWSSDTAVFAVPRRTATVAA